MREWQTHLDTLKNDKRVPLALTLCVGLLFVWAFIDFLMIFFQPSYHLPPKPTATASQKPTKNLAELHLFGAYSLVALPTTDLQLSLVGTVVVLNEPTTSQALISSPNGPTKVYHAGETVPGNATVNRVDKNYVILNVNGSLEKLALPVQTVAGIKTT